MMNRRTFIGMSTGGLLVTPLLVKAQQLGKVYRIGWISLEKASSGIESFRSGLSDLGWIEGRNIAIETRFADNKPDRLPALAAELVELKVDVIVTHTTPAAVAAKKATALIPIVMAGADNPVMRGLVTNLNHPGENITGLTNNPGVGFHQKMVQLLREAAPGVSRLAVLWGIGEEGDLTQIQAAAPALGLTVVSAPARESDQVTTALAAAVRAGANGLHVTASPLNSGQRRVIVDFALANRLPSMFGAKDFVTVGGLMSYWTDWVEVRRRSATYVDKILKGAKPGDLPIEQPSKFELVINVKTAKALGLSIPHSLLLRADQLVH
jgi:putative tryptophan/tyrosine transport system substrate-binding protein